MSELVYYLRGVFDGDGYYSKRNCIVVNLTDYDFLEEIQRCVKKVFNKHSIIKPTKVYGKKSKPQWRITVFIGGEGAVKKLRALVPTSREQKIQYLKGMFDAEGHIGIYEMPVTHNPKNYMGKDKFLNLSQSNHTDLKLWSTWLDELGIENSIMFRDDGRSRINIRKNDAIKKYNELIGFRIKRKQDTLNEVISLMKKSPITKEAGKKMVEVYQRTNFGPTYIGKMFNRTKPNVVKFLRRGGFYTGKKSPEITANDIDIAESILGYELPFKIENHRMKKFSTENLQFSKIKSIKKHSSQKGYDLHTPKYHNFFLGNGILSHNSVLAQQIAAYWCYAIEKTYGVEIPFTTKDNIVFHGSELIKKGNRIGRNHKYGALIFDEAGADLEGVKAMTKSTQNVKDFFRECGQYNMLNILCLPEFFDLPKGIATNRSNCLIDCYVTAGHDDMWERGKFNFFSAPTKKKLYRLGKKELNYAAVKCDFYGTWDNIYTIDEKEYKAMKVEALKTREVFNAREDTRLKYLRGALKILYYKDKLSHREIAKQIGEFGKFNTNHRYVGKLLVGEKPEDEDDE